jgi:hypothetical protein
MSCKMPFFFGCVMGKDGEGKVVFKVRESEEISKFRRETTEGV